MLSLSLCTGRKGRCFPVGTRVCVVSKQRLCWVCPRAAWSQAIKKEKGGAKPSKKRKAETPAQYGSPNPSAKRANVKTPKPAASGAWRGMAWRGVAWRGVAWRGMRAGEPRTCSPCGQGSCH